MMPVPILKLGRYQIATVRASLDDSQWLAFRDKLLAQVGAHRSTGVVIDVSSMDVMDSFATRMIRSIAQMLRLRGAETVIVGIQPDVAYAMAQLGLTLRDAATALDLEEGLDELRRRIAGRAHA